MGVIVKLKNIKTKEECELRNSQPKPVNTGTYYASPSAAKSAIRMFMTKGAGSTGEWEAEISRAFGIQPLE